MTPFLRQIAEVFYKEQGNSISDTCFVFPSRRAGKFFVEHLKNISKGNNLLAPECLTISEFFDSLSPNYEKEEKIGLLFHLYNSYNKVLTNYYKKKEKEYNETFNDFIGIGEIILKDFNDLDNYLVEAKYIFSNIEEIARYKKENILTKEQIECIENFLGLFAKDCSKYKEKSYELWCNMLEIYNDFKENLLKEGIGYEGMIHRMVVENEIPDHLLPNQVVFVGFNALDGATKALFNKLKSKGIADFYWDYDFKYADVSKDKDNKAHYFIKNNLENYKSKYNLEKQSYPETKIRAIGCNSNIGQTKFVHQLLSNELKDEDGIKSALVLANESLLVPMLYAIPEKQVEEQQEGENDEEVESKDIKVNVTMGYPIKSSNIFNFINFFLLLHRNYNKEKGYRTDNIKTIISHSYITEFCKPSIDNIDKKVFNNLYASPEILPQDHELLEMVFKPCDSKDNDNKVDKNILLINRTLDILKYLNEKKEDIDIEKECILQASMAITRIKSLLNRYKDIISIDSYTIYRIIMSILKTVNISFFGEPLSGLQMMGMLETRCLDFDNIIITSFNEGVFPKSDIGTSLIPYDIRKPYGLPTTDHQDAIFSYNFYRLIKRASNVWLIYDTRNDSEGSSGEASRFVKQLEYLYNVKVEHFSVSNTTKVTENKEIIIPKTKEDRDKIESFLKDNGLSPSVLNNYLKCPLRFYYEKVKGVYEQKEQSPIIDAAQIGTTFHNVMEQLYKPFKNKVVNKSDIDKITDEQIRETTTQAFKAAIYNKKYEEADNINYDITGENKIIYEVIVDMVINTLKCDGGCDKEKYKGKVPFTHKEEEVPVYKPYTTASKKQIQIKGTIDRIDIKEDKVHLIDYKTTKLKDIDATKVYDLETIKKFFDCDNNYKENEKKYALELLQMCFYNLLYKDEANGKEIETYLYLAKMSYDHVNFLENTKVVLPEGWEEVFRENLDRVIDDLLDLDKPFTQSKEPNNKNCSFCQFLPICGKIIKEN